MKNKVIIIGSGPGGLQLGYFLKKLGIEYIILEKSSISGNFFSRFPVHKKLISINKVYTGHSDKIKNLRWDWNSLLSDNLDPIFSTYDKSYFPHSDAMVEYLNEFASKNKLNIQYNTKIERIEKNNCSFILHDQNNTTYKCEILVNATGLTDDYIPNIPGIKYAQNYSELDLDYDKYINKKVLIIGKGNSAFETAESIIPYSANIHLISPQNFRFAWVSHYPGDIRSVNTNLIDTFFLKQQNAILNGSIIRIDAVDNKYRVTVKYEEDGEIDVNEYDHVINCTGFKINISFFADTCHPILIHDDRLPELTCEWESVNVKNLFFAGTLMQSNDYKHSSSAFIHGIRHNVEVLSEVIRQRTVNSKWISSPIDKSLIFEKIINRIQLSSSLWFLFSSLLDVFHFDENSNDYNYYQDIPKRVFNEAPLFNCITGFVFCFGYDIPDCPEERIKFSEHGFLHPILRYYFKGNLKAEKHMLEDIYGEWTDMNHFGGEFNDMLNKHL